jgi:hypothetical protein
MSAATSLQQTFDLPHGFSVTFVWSLANGFKINWKPAVPGLPIHAREDLDVLVAYWAARCEFFRDVAALGGEMGICQLGTRH